jgi:hypothetical protein
MANIFLMNKEIARGMVCFFHQKMHFYLINIINSLTSLHLLSPLPSLATLIRIYESYIRRSLPLARFAKKGACTKLEPLMNRVIIVFVSPTKPSAFPISGPRRFQRSLQQGLDLHPD